MKRLLTYLGLLATLLAMPYHAKAANMYLRFWNGAEKVEQMNHDGGETAWHYDFYTSDDVLEKIAEAFEANSIEAVYGDVHYVNDDDLKKQVRYYSSARFKRWQMRFGMMPAHPSFYCKRSVYEKYGVFDTSYKIAADFENLLRLIFLGKIKTYYINKDFVTMRTGGASTAGLKSRMVIMKEHLRALKAHGIYSNFLMLSLRYIYKVYELIRR